MSFTLGALGLAYLGTAAWLDRRGLRPPPDERFDAIVVLGCKVVRGGRPSTSLARRAGHAARLWHEGRAPTLVLTGGVGHHPPSEAAVAARVARALDVPEDALVLEERSTSTEENAREAARLVGDDRRVLVVTDAYHAFRAERVFRRHFTHAVAVGSAAPVPLRVRGALREVTAVGTYAFLGRL
ncbi:MAG TPA: YdcF family protein [Sandaracinaceae bacterium LLY-WYZ-13_1]|nr:YdcF family protein [Sandaracinaceae bacterium LLY-WYZ-13_1]